MIARGKREERVALGTNNKENRGLKGRNNAGYYALSGLVQIDCRLPGATRFALAPGYHISAPLALKQSWTNYYFPV